MNRTWLCSVVFMDIVNYSSQSTELQIKWKERFNGYLATAIKDVPEDERVILDTGDGAATCFLGAPESAMFTALGLWHSLLIAMSATNSRRCAFGLASTSGPVKLVRDINGAANAIGDGMNAGQRVMSFAGGEPESWYRSPISGGGKPSLGRLQDPVYAERRKRGLMNSQQRVTSCHASDLPLISLRSPPAAECQSRRICAGRAHQSTEEYAGNSSA